MTALLVRLILFQQIITVLFITVLFTCQFILTL